MSKIQIVIVVVTAIVTALFLYAIGAYKLSKIQQEIISENG